LVKIVIIDDHPMVVDGLKSVLMADGSLNVVGSSPSLARGLALIQEYSPDVVILDMRLNDASGISVVERTRRISASCALIVLTGFGASLRDECMRAGADAYLSKEMASDTIVRTIRQLVPVPETSLLRPDSLSAREREVAALAASGKSNPEIAELLGVSVNTVKTHLSHIMAKLGVNGRVALALTWKDRGETSNSR
jgi:DNA-binding NarL/FixJ family response regulator